MKQLRSSLSDLWQLFDQTITVRAIAEPLISFDAKRRAATIRQEMERRGFDVAGLMRDGSVEGYVRRERLGIGLLGRYHEAFDTADVLSDSSSLVAAFGALRHKPFVFVQILGRVGAVVTRADFQKAPVRMFLFGLLTLIEMQMLRIIRSRYEGDAWEALLGDRIKGVRRIFEERRKQNIETDLLDCLQWCDKRTLILAQEDLIPRLGFASGAKAETSLNTLEHLRNDLAHSQDFVRENWKKLDERFALAQSLLGNLERIRDDEPIAENKMADAI